MCVCVCVCVCMHICIMYVCVYTHTHTYTSDCVETVCELPLLPNDTAAGTFLHKSGAVRSVDWTLITGRWPGGNWSNT